MRPLLARSQRRELIDDVRMSPAEAAAVFGNLATINRFLGGYQVTLEAVQRLIPTASTPLRVLDVGAGGGDMARTLIAWGKSVGRRVTVVSVDIDAAAIRFARRSLQAEPDAALVQGDAMALPFADDTFDVVTCALFMHHMPWDVADEIVRALWSVSRHGVVINDLHRHPFACGAIWLLTRLLGAHPIVQHDAPLSVLRGFARDELLAMGRRIGLPIEVRWRWAFRYLVTVPKHPLPRPKRRGRPAMPPPAPPPLAAECSSPHVPRLRKHATVAMLVTTLAMLLSSLRPAAADVVAPTDPNQIMMAYTRDPIRNRAALLALARRTDIELPVAVTLMAGDAALRAGAPHTAVRRFERVIANGLQEPWLGWTRLALGWIALTREDVREARSQFEMATGSPANTGAAAHLALGLIDASERVDGAASEFARVANDAGADPALREAATLGGAYARYWAGSFDEARAAFLAIADRGPASPLADDARYAAAWMAVHTGAQADALEELTTLAESGVTPGRRESGRHDLLNLEPRALMQAGVHRYRRGSVASPDRQLAKLLDGDGVRLARAALRWIGELETTRTVPRDPLTRPWAARPVSAAAVDRELVLPPTEPVAHPALESAKPHAPNVRPTSGWRVMLGLVAVALAVVAAIVLRSEGRGRPW